MDHYNDHYEEIGRLLQSAREDMQLDIAEAARQMHIRPRYLEALEHGKLEKLPGLPYAKGYLQTYASFLRLDQNEILRRFEQVEALIDKRGFYFPQVFSKTKTRRPPGGAGRAARRARHVRFLAAGLKAHPGGGFGGRYFCRKRAAAQGMAAMGAA